METLTTVRLSKGHFALIELRDEHLIAGYHWCSKVKHDGRVYAQASTVLCGRKTTILMHRLLVGAKPGQKVDHADGDGLHNWRENLRVCGQSQNNQNSVRRKRRVTSRYKGVWRSKGRESFRAGLKLNGKRLHLGMFSSEESAAKAYDAAAKRHFGEFARLNFPDKDAA